MLEEFSENALPLNQAAKPEKVGPSDGCRGNAVPLAPESKYDFRELETYLGNVG